MANLAPQSLHIFKKDLRHLWPETLVVVALFIAFAWAAPSGWTASPYASVSNLVAALLKLLMPISWLVVISRLVHDEPLVGDRQFWTSRPYHWAKLLAAKLLYLVVFLYLPFFLMQVYLLKHAGLYPTTAIPALLHNLLLLTVAIVVPLTAIAAVTSSFARLLLSVIGGILYLLVLSLTLAWFAWRHLAPPAMIPVFTTIVILLPAIALVYQYATRKTNNARIMLVLTPLLVAVLVLITPATALIRHGYPLASGKDVPTLTDFPDQYRPKAPAAGPLRIERNQVPVTVPFTVANLDKNSNYVIQGVAATVDAPGVHWSSPYIGTTGDQINASSPFGAANIDVPLSVFNQIHNLPAEIHLSLATDHQKADPPSTWKATAGSFAVPGHGVCSFSHEDPELPPLCRYAFQTPDINFATADLAPGSCSAAGPKVPGGVNLGGAPGMLDFDPVITIPVKFRTANPQQPGVLCAGTPIKFIEAKVQDKVRLEITEKNFVIENFAAHATPDSPQMQPAPQASEGQRLSRSNLAARSRPAVSGAA